MQDAIPDLLRIDIEETWHRCPPPRDAVVRAFSSAGWVAPSERDAEEAAYLALAKILDLGTRSIPIRPSASLNAQQKAAAAFGELLRAMTPIIAEAGGPPPPPREWLNAMGAWCKEVEKKKPSVGSPQNQFLHTTVPMLLALYQVTFGRKPAATAGGPTERFMMSIHIAMSEAWKGATPDDPEWGRNVREKWQAPEQAALLQRIKTLREKAESYIPLIQHFLDGFYDTLSSQPQSPTRH